jgi:hypothetical protein
MGHFEEHDQDGLLATLAASIAAGYGCAGNGKLPASKKADQSNVFDCRANLAVLFRESRNAVAFADEIKELDSEQLRS